MTCVVLFTLSSMLCGLAPSLPWLIFFRVMQGLGGGALQPTSQAILVETFPHEKRGAAMALYGMGVVFAPIIGPVLGGWITDNYSWHWIFLINIPVGIAVPGAHLPDGLRPADPQAGVGEGRLPGRLPGHRHPHPGPGRPGDRPGRRPAPGLVRLQPDHRLRRRGRGGCLVGVVFYLLKKDHPIIDLRLLKDRNFAMATVMLFVLGFVLYGSLALLPIFLQTLLGYTASLSGWILSPGGVVILVMMPVVALLLRQLRHPLPDRLGLPVLRPGPALDVRASTSQVDFHTAMLARMVQSFGLAFLFVPMNVTAFQNVPHEKASYASGMLNLVRNIGGSAGIALVTTILARRSQLHQANLVANLHPASLPYQGFLARRRPAAGAARRLRRRTPPARPRAWPTAPCIRQATMMAFADTFWIMGALCLALLPLVFLMRKTHAGRAAAGGDMTSARIGAACQPQAMPPRPAAASRWGSAPRSSVLPRRQGGVDQVGDEVDRQGLPPAERRLRRPAASAPGA